jgi:hypothetical protein
MKMLAREDVLFVALAFFTSAFYWASSMEEGQGELTPHCPRGKNPEIGILEV